MIHPDILKNKVALITGSSQGVGAELAKCFCEQGYHVILVDYNKDLGLEMENRLQGCSKFYHCDLSDETQVDSLAALLNNHYRAIDVIIHNARSPAKEKDPIQNLDKEWDSSIKVMLKNPIRLNHLLLTLIKKSSNPSILFIGSTNSYFISQQPLSYHVVKGALSQTVRYLACEYGQLKIRVNLLNPGIIDIPGRPRKNPELFREVVEAVIPLKRAVTAREVGECCLFLASDKARYFTGSSVDLDGGEHLKDHFSLAMSQTISKTTI